MSVDDAIVHFVDDDERFRSAITRLLRQSGFAVRDYASAGEFLVAGAGDAPGCLLLDVQMPGPSGLDLQEALTRYGIDLPIVFITGYGDVPSSVRAMKGGAVDFLVKPIDREPLVKAVRNALARNALDRSSGQRRRALRALYDTLTPRERAVFAGVVAGKLNKQIAFDLDAAERTVKTHRANLLEKMHVQSVAELVRVAIELGLVPPSDSDAPKHS